MASSAAGHTFQVRIAGANTGDVLATVRLLMGTQEEGQVEMQCSKPKREADGTAVSVCTVKLSQAYVEDSQFELIPEA